jgi:hypothetical protein
MPAPPVFRIYLSTVPGDMEGERAMLAELVLPELQRQASGLGTEIVWLDPEAELPAAEPGEWDLAARLRAIASCDFFLGLLGERYGDPPAFFPPGLDTGPSGPDRTWSVAEIEIQAALKAHAGPRLFFYFRQPVQAEEERLAALKEKMRASGRPLFDGYPCRWNPESGRAEELEVFAQRVFEDLWVSLNEEVLERAEETGSELWTAGEEALYFELDEEPEVLTKGSFGDYSVPPPMAPPVAASETPRAHLSPEKALPVHEDVQFTVYRPRVVEPLRWYTLLAFAHLEALPADAPPGEPQPWEEVERQARQALGDMADSYAEVQRGSRHAVPHEAEVTFLLEIPGFEVNPPRRTFLWLESVHREDFRLRAGAGLAGRTARGRLCVFLGSILLAELAMTIRVEAGAAALRQPPTERDAIRPFRNIFASYSHRDVVVVEELERYARAIGDRYLRDVHDLRAGERWSERLEGLIREADVFQLFWSWNAIRSDYMEQEWRYALGLRRPHFVRPTYWEVPLPSAPDRGMPPEELTRLHFQLLTVGVEAHPPAPPTRSLDDTVVAAAPPPVVAAPPPPPSLDDTRVAAPPPPPDAAPRVGTTPPVFRGPASLEDTKPVFPAPDLAPRPPAREASSRPAPTGSWAMPGSAPSRRSSPGGLIAYVLGAVLAVLIALLFLVRGCGLGSSTAESTELIHLIRPPGAESPASSSSADPNLPAPPPNWKSWRDGARACGLAFSDLERIARTARSAGKPAVEVLPADGERQPSLRQRLADGGEKAFIMPVSGEGRPACTVWIGPLGSNGEAEELARRVSSTYGVEARAGGLPDIDALGRSQRAP